MNTLLGELATLNDVQFPRYRVAFKFRKLQKHLFLEHGTVTMLSEVMHLTGLQRLRDKDIVPLSQLSSVLSELYGAIRTNRPVLKPAQLQQAQDWAYNWLQLAYRTGSGETIEATHLKITLCLFLGSKGADKARFIFGQLANANGAIEKAGVRRFVRILQELAHALQENVYEEYPSLDQVFQDCLVFVRNSEDVEDEQLDGGIRRQWLSQFEFTALLTATPPPPFFSWLLLWFALPGYENVIHSVRCTICARKPIVCFRYQCVQCHNYHMCQMCFLKGRTSDKHQQSHQVLEFSSKGRTTNRSWHHRLLGLPHRGAAMGGRMVTDEKKPFSFRAESRTSRNSSNEETDIALTALTDVISTSEGNPVMNGEGTHKPEIIRIGSDGKPDFPSRKTSAPAELPSSHTLQTSPAWRMSTTSGSSSPDSLSSAGAGGKFLFEGAQVSRSNGGNPGTLPTRGLKTTVSDGMVTESKSKKEDLTEVNRRLSMEVDRILSDLPSPSSRIPNSPLRLHANKLSPIHHENQILESDLEGIHREEEQLQVQVSQLTDKREKLSHELQDLMSQVQQMQVGFQTLGRRTNTSSWAPLMSPTSHHTRCDSAPVQSPTPSSSSSTENSLPPLEETEVSPEPAPTISRTKKEREPLGYKPRVFTPDLGMAHNPLHDPLSEFHADEYDDTSHSNSLPDHRISVAW